MQIKLLFLIILIGISTKIFSKEELTVIRTTSKDKKSFVVQKGLQNGISRGQEVIFGNDNVSIVCKAIEVSREYSLWIPVDKNMMVPFKKEDIVSLNTHTFGNVAVDLGNGVQKINPDVDYNLEFEKLRTQNSITARYSYGGAVSQSSSSVSTSQNSKKKSEDFNFEYGFRINPAYEISIGGRLDYEVYRLTTPELDIPTTRQFITLSFTYHAVAFSSNKNNLYATATIGIGNSKTTVDNEVSSGLATILPEVKIGYLFPISKEFALVGEVGVESVAAQEKFSDGSKQDTTQVNTKASIGIRF